MTEAGFMFEDNIRSHLNSVLQGSCDVDWKDKAHAHQTILMKLCYYDESEDSLLEILDNVLSLNPDVNIRDNYGRTAFAHACISQNYSMIDALLFVEATLIDTVDKEECSPLTYAIRTGDEHMVDKILSHPKARSSGLLATRTKGKTPLDFAISLGNPAIVDILRSCSRYTPGAEPTTPNTKCNRRYREALPEVRVSRRTPIIQSASRAFITTKSHSDPLLLRRFDQRKSHTVDRGFSGESPSRRHTPGGFSDTSGHGLAKDISASHQRAGCRDLGNPDTCTLPRLAIPATSHRRGSLSLPDLTLIPGALGRVDLDSECNSDEETDDADSSLSSQKRCEQESTRSQDSSTDSDTEENLSEKEILQRNAAANRRRNSISLPDLCCKSSTGKKNSKLASNYGIRNSNTDIPSVTNENGRRIHRGGRLDELRLPPINKCNSPSLPALDRKSLREQSLQKHNSAHNLNLSVRRPIAGDGDSLRRLVDRRKDDIVLQSVT